MELLKCKTRGGSSPQGKPRVFFCCHPLEYETFFEDISNEILGKQNCAVWYLSHPNAERNEELLADLKQMQLFVMPVTSRLLCTQNPALDTDFRFASEHHIPVLPLMQESGLETLFNEKCGDLQFLDKYTADTTAISYDEKLENYLNSILIGDELAEKIRAAFDAYVFLSYRKKDRKYAQELMRLIHKNEFCRDIAIWYDEFLTPGENFNESIRDALLKSGLFVLAITPNLVNETNYIMTTEYPMALDAQKPILPAELVPTDRSLLSEKYADLPACTDAHNEAALSDALLEAIQKIAIQENDGSPEHNFFIGLAYLGGVDVEIDHERALSLITSAAEAGLAEAITKLVEMYSSGLGVERNYVTAIEWQERKIDIQKAEYEQAPSVSNLNRLFWTICECGDQYKHLQTLEQAKEKYVQGMQLLEASSHTSDPLIRRDLSAIFNYLGDIFKAQRNPAEAQAYYEKGLILSEARFKQTGSREAHRDMSVSYERLGNIARAQGKLAVCQTYYEKEAAISETLVKERNTLQARRDLSISYEKLGEVATAQGNLTSAQAYYEKCLSIRETLAQETDSPQARRDLSVSYNKLGDIVKAQGKLATAHAYYEKSLAISEPLASETATPDALRDLSVSYDNLGLISKEQGDLAAAQAYFEKGLAICEALAQQLGTAEARRDLSVSYNNLGYIAMLRGDLAAAQVYYEKDLAISETLAQQLATVESRRDLAASYNELGNIAKARDDLAAAQTYYEKGLAVTKALAKETGTMEARRDLSISYNNLGNIIYARGELAAAQEHYEKCLAIREELASESCTIEARRNLSNSYSRLGDIANAKTELSAALAYYKKSLAIRKALAKETDSPRSWDDLAVSYYKIAMVAPEEKTAALQAAIDIYRNLCQTCPDVKRYAANLKHIRSLLEQ